MSAATGGIVLTGRYRLVAPLATGGMGTVWRAYDDMLDRPVAVKEVLLPPGLDDEARETLRRRTMREARAAAQLRRPAIVTVYDVVEQDGRPWIVMELVPSVSLDAVIRRRGSLPPVEAAGIGLRILDALVTAQAAGVQHRDIKPANVLLAEDGRVVLTDFGIARHVGDETLTSAGLLVGSPNFLAPERARGLDSPGLQADLWSLGATLYAAVEGHLPFERNGPLPTLAAVVMDEPPPPRKAGPLRPVIEGLLVKNPAHRLDANHARAMLQRALRGQGGETVAARLPVAPAPADPTLPLPRVRPFQPSPSAAAPVPTPPPQAATPASDRPAGVTSPPERAAAGGEESAAHAPVPAEPAAGQRAPAPTGPTGATAAGAAVAAAVAPEPERSAGDLPAAEGAGPAGAAAAGAAGAPAASARPPATAPGQEGARPGRAAGETSRPDRAATQDAGPGRAAGQTSQPDRTATRDAGPGRAAGQTSQPDQPATQDAGPGRAAGQTSQPDQPATRDAGPGRAAGQTSQPDRAVTRGAGSTAQAPVRAAPAAEQRTPEPSVPGTGAAAGAGRERAEPAAVAARTAAPEAPARERRGPRRGLLAAAVLAVVAVLAAVLIPRALDNGPSRGQAAPAPTPAQVPAASNPPPTGQGAAASPTAAPTGSGVPAAPAPSAGRGSGSATRAQPPAGFTHYVDPRTGFSVFVPQGWRPGPGRNDSQVDFQDPRSGRFLRIETSDAPQPDPYQNWVYYERVYRQGKPDYRKIKIESIDYGSDKGWRTADWEFVIGGTHVLDRNILVSSRRAHALYWSTPESLWSTAESRRIFQVAADSFQPAPVG